MNQLTRLGCACIGASSRRYADCSFSGHDGTGTCALCGRTYPVAFLVAAHVKQRASCSEEERRDWAHVVMPLCKFGCDDLYEHGYVSVEPGGKIVTRPDVWLTPTFRSG